MKNREEQIKNIMFQDGLSFETAEWVVDYCIRMDARIPEVWEDICEYPFEYKGESK